MRVFGYIVMGILGVLAICFLIGAAKLESMERKWEWLHPPEDDDGVSILEDDNDPDGNCSR